MIDFDFNTLKHNVVYCPILLLDASINTFNTYYKDCHKVIGKIYKETYYLNFRALYEELGNKGFKAYFKKYVKDMGIKICVFFEWPLSEFGLDYLEELRLNLYLVVYFCDIPEYFNIHKCLSQYLDLILVDEYLEKYRFMLFGADSLYLSPCFSVENYKNLSLEKDIDVSFIGRMDRIGRQEYIEFIKRNDIDIKVYGIGTENGPVSKEEMINIFNRSKINLNFCGISKAVDLVSSDIMDKAIRQTKGRMMEIALTKSFVLSEFTHSISKHFKIGHEIEIFYDNSDLIEKLKYYLNNEVDRESIAQRGYERAIKDYDSMVVWDKMLTIIQHKAYDKKYSERKTYIDGTFWKTINSERARNIIGFLRHKKPKCAMEELLLVLNTKKIYLRSILNGLLKEMFRPFFLKHIKFKKQIIKIRDVFIKK